MNKQGIGKIEYLDYTFNPITGCCHPCKDQYCYARKIAERFGREYKNLKNYEGLQELKEPFYSYTKCMDIQVDPYPYGFEPTFHHYRLDEPKKIKQPSIIGVVYMGDLFGEWVPDEWIDEVFQACFNADWHTYMFLTKNPKRYDDALKFICCEERGFEIEYWDRFWFGATVTCQEDVHRKDALLTFSEGKKFLSIEPLISQIDIGRFGRYESNGIANYYTGIDWVIIGQQTGPGAVPPKPEWVQSIIDQCRAAGVPVFVKNPLYKQFPIQEWPEGLVKVHG